MFTYLLNLNCLLETYCRLNIIEKLFVTELTVFQTYGVINYGSRVEGRMS